MSSATTRRSSTHRSCDQLFLLMALVLSYLATPCKAVYVVRIPPKDEECFFVMSGNKPGTLYGSFDQISDGTSANHLSVIIMTEDKQQKSPRILFRSRKGHSEGTFKVNLDSDQKVSICLQNGIWTNGRRKSVQNKPHDGDTRTVGLEFTIEPRSVGTEVKTQHSKLMENVQELGRSLGNLLNHHEYMRTREAIHRETVEATFSRLLNYAVLQGFAVIFVAGAQILYFRRFVEVRRYI